ncbi:UNVERIFIED_CONTAM: Retrovirus-related Pol polyprotein from transposon RE2 [Sesamum latifolium]|uniref:Retrovirus-related Pol polyprotein from transposon RE2 n=1 Tax=Sesamum latifolium TaxID=2727402 RepID=A0AAW2WC03_9LAMI
MAGKINSEKHWIIDSRATKYVTWNGELLEEKNGNIQWQPIKVPNGESIAVRVVGKISLPNGMETNDVLNIPNFKCNLLFVSRLTRDFSALTFLANFCIIQDLPTRNLIGAARHCGGLYLLELVLDGGVAMTVSGKHNSTLWRWRLGHASSSKIKLIQSNSSIVKNDLAQVEARHSQWVRRQLKHLKEYEINLPPSIAQSQPIPYSRKHAIDSKWVYKIKLKPNGEVECYKARLVAKGFIQVEGIDFYETFAPVAKLVTVRCLIAVAAKKNWEIHQLDVNNAFCHGDLDEEVYMRIPQGFSKEGKMRNGESFIVALIYVDDVILTENDAKKIQEIKVYLNKNFGIKDLGALKYSLEIEVARSPQGIVLSQRKYTLDNLQEAGMLGCKPNPFSMEQTYKLSLDHDGPRTNALRYKRLIGVLLYLMVVAVGQLKGTSRRLSSVLQDGIEMAESRLETMVQSRLARLTKVESRSRAIGVSTIPPKSKQSLRLAQSASI